MFANPRLPTLQPSQRIEACRADGRLNKVLSPAVRVRVRMCLLSRSIEDREGSSVEAPEEAQLARIEGAPRGVRSYLA